MKAIDILRWISSECVDGEYIVMIDVPESQNEEWWIDRFGNCPPFPAEKGTYLYFYTDAICYCTDNYPCELPDIEIEIPVRHGFEYINFYKID